MLAYSISYITGPTVKGKMQFKVNNVVLIIIAINASKALFPKCEDRRQLWIRAMQRDNWQPPANSRVCSAHFEEKYIDRTSMSCVRLRENAVPTIFSKKQKTMNNPIASARLNLELPGSSKESLLNVTLQDHMDVLPGSSQKVELPYSSKEPLLNATLQDHTEVLPGSSEKITSISKIFHNSEQNELQTHTQETVLGQRMIIRKLSKICSDQRRKMRTLQQWKRRSTKRIANLKQIISEISKKRLIASEDSEILKELGEPVQELLKRHVSKTRGKISKKYPPNLRKFALTLNFLSPRAYVYVRESFNTCLPHPRTLSKWYTCVDGSPGFTQEALNTLKIKTSVSNWTPICALMIDEMSIRKFIEWDGSKYYGYVDFGINSVCQNMDEATSVIVFLLVCINGSWKLPIGYFLIVALSAEQKKELVMKCVQLVEETGAKIVSLTFDGAPSNITMAKLL